MVLVLRHLFENRFIQSLCSYLTDDYFEPLSSPFDGFLSNQEAGEQHDGLGNVLDNRESELKFQRCLQFHQVILHSLMWPLRVLLCLAL